MDPMADTSPLCGSHQSLLSVPGHNWPAANSAPALHVTRSSLGARRPSHRSTFIPRPHGVPAPEERPAASETEETDRSWSWTDPCPLADAHTPTPPWYLAGDLDLEAGCSRCFLSARRNMGILAWLGSVFLGPRLDHRVRNPAAGGARNYRVNPSNLWVGFLLRLALFLVYCTSIMLYNQQLGLSCGRAPAAMADVSGNVPVPPAVPRSILILGAETLISAGTCFLLAQGYLCMRATRERMERVRQTAVTVAYSLVKTTNPGFGYRERRAELQLLIYECLALLTAYPVALSEQVRGNCCEPAVTNYCRDAAIALRHLRRGNAVIGGNPYLSHYNPSSAGDENHREFVTVDYFFEVFALQLEMEYRRQPMVTNGPSVSPQHIIFNIRNHFEDMVDYGKIDDRRAPILRENIDMMALAGREVGIFTYTDVAPFMFIWAIHVGCWVVALSTPIQNCDWLINTTESTPVGLKTPAMWPIFWLLVMAFLCASLLTLLGEMWRMWDPFRGGVNTTAWTCGVAMEIDNLVNEFYEYDNSAMARKHAYMKRPIYSDGGGEESPLAHPQTV